MVLPANPLTIDLDRMKTAAWMALVQPDGTVQQTHGGPKECSTGADLVALVREDHRPLVMAALRDTVTPGLTHRVDIEIDTPAGRRVWDCSVSPADGNALIIGLEVTQSRREEERLKHSERLMRDTQGISHLGTWYWDISEPHAHWSPELYQIYGLDPERHTPTYQDYLTRVHPDDVERVKKATELVFKEQVPYSHDERIRRSDGKWRYLHTWGRPIMDDHGNLIALMGVCQDITDQKTAEEDLKKSETRYRAIFDLAGDGLAVINRDGTIRSANRTLQDLCGIPEAELEGLDLAQMIHKEDKALFYGALGATETGPVVETLRFVDWDTKVTFVPLPDNEVLVFVEGASDPSDQSGLIRQLEEESQWKSRILQVASHELKNPLTPILMNLHTIKGRGTLDEKSTEILERTANQVKRLSRMVHSLLDTARLERGGAVVNWQTWDLDVLVDAVIKDLAQEAAGKDVQIQRTGSAGQVEGDREMIWQVLVNLLQNAIRHTPDGTTVTVHLEDGPRVTVTDEGPGIPSEAIDQLFRPFQRLGPRLPGSTGLGLWVSKTIMDAHEGKIGVEPGPPGKFWFEWTPRS